MAIEPIFEKITVNGKRQAESEPIKTECRTGVATDGISEVLSVFASANVLGCDTGERLVKCDGRAIFYVCYLAVDGTVKKTECSADFSAAVKSECVKEGYKAVCHAQVVKTEYELTGANLSVSATLTIEAELLENIDITALSGGENLIIDNQEVSVNKSFGLKEGTYPVEEEFELSCEVKEVLCHRASASITGTQCGVGTVIVDGQVYLTVIALQKAEKCSIIKEVRCVPYRMELEYEEAMPTMRAIASVCEKGLKTDVLVDEQTGKSKVTAQVNLQFTGEVWTAEEKSIAKDAFSINENVEIIKEQAECYAPCEPCYTSTQFNGRAGTSELPVGVVLFAVGCEKAEILTSEYANGKLKITGVVSAVGYFADGEGKPFVRKLETAFEKEIDCELTGQIDYLLAKAEKVNARLISATEVELDGELILTVCTKQKMLLNCIKDIKSAGVKKENSHAISVYIPLENEELWSLSKRLNVCPNTLVETNPELTFPLTGKERIVVYRKI